MVGKMGTLNPIVYAVLLVVAVPAMLMTNTHLVYGQTNQTISDNARRLGLFK